MSVATIREDLRDILAARNDTGRIYDYLRWAVDMDTFNDLFKYEDQIRAWQISYNGLSTDPHELGPGEIWQHNFTLIGILAVEDQSETDKELDNVTEAIANDIRTSTVLNTTYYYHRAAAARTEERRYGSVLVHYAEIDVQVQETK